MPAHTIKKHVQCWDADCQHPANSFAHDLDGYDCPDCGKTMTKRMITTEYCEIRYECQCGREGEERYSMGITAGIWCNPCWAKSGYRKVPASAFDPTYCGEEW